MSLRRLQVSLIVLCLVFVCLSAQAEIAKSEYIEIFTNGSSVQQREAAKGFRYLGLSDPEIFDLVEQRLLERYATAESNNAVETVAWLTKGLGYSGLAKYRSTIELVASENSPTGKARKHASNALSELDVYAVWNPVISDTSNWNAEESDDLNRYVNMLRSDILELKRIGAKRVYHERITSEYVLAVLQAQSDENYKTVSKDKVFIDTLAWMCKGLAATALPEYRPTIVEVSQNAGAKKVRKYALKYLNYFDD